MTDDGALTMTRWYFEPPDQLLRLITLTRAMMSELGISNPARHIMLVRDARSGYDRTPATYIFKKSEFTDDEVRTIESVCRVERLRVVVHASDSTRERVHPNDRGAGPRRCLGKLRNKRRADSRQQSVLLQLGSAGEPLEGDRRNDWRVAKDKPRDARFCSRCLGSQAVLVLLFIIGPLVLVRGRALATGVGTKLSYLLYFACLGAGFHHRRDSDDTEVHSVPRSSGLLACGGLVFSTGVQRNRQLSERTH